MAALPKIVDPPAFAHMIYNYRILPGGLINISSLVMPWLELLCGAALVIGLWRRPALAIISLLLLLFIAAISLNLARGNAIDCGCFNVSLANRTVEQRLGDMRLDIFRDLGMLLMCAQLWRAYREERLSGRSEGAALPGRSPMPS